VATYLRRRGRRGAFQGIVRMTDLLYVLGTIGFFAAMLAYVRGCEALGHRVEAEERDG